MYGTVRAPEIDLQGLVWFNTERPLGLADLRGKVVILDFWTFCCINCIHILPSLARVEAAFPEEVVVIGVHSPKFAAEREPARVEQAIARYGIAHPVVHDPEFRIWRAYAVRAWPTLVFLGPDGSVIGQHSGEPDPDKLLQAVAGLLAQAKERGDLLPSLLPLTSAATTAGRLRFPGKMKPLPGAAPACWAVADAGHHQVVLLDDDGEEVRRFGSGEPGFQDGPQREARFHAPQGLIAAAGRIYIADTGNHAVREIDIASGMVRTLAGTGRRGGALPETPRPGLQTALASPWDLELEDDRLYIANAGTHQLGWLDLGTGRVGRLAGDGGEAIEDGPAASARLAQPSGLALDRARRRLYFADSETSAIRVVDLAEPAAVRTLIGTGLFDFGHRSGSLAEARLQHPLGVAVQDGELLLVADSYNGAVRSIDLQAGRIRDLDEGEYLCLDPVCMPADEPAGVAADATRVYLVDTNNHRILAYELAEKRYRTWAE